MYGGTGQCDVLVACYNNLKLGLSTFILFLSNVHGFECEYLHMVYKRTVIVQIWMVVLALCITILKWHFFYQHINTNIEVTTILKA